MPTGAGHPSSRLRFATDDGGIMAQHAASGSDGEADASVGAAADDATTVHVAASVSDREGAGGAMSDPSLRRGPGGPVEESLGDRAARALLEYREGRAQALEALVREVTPLLWHTARAQGVDTQTADDVVQDTWVALVRHVDTIDEPHAVLKWLIVTAKRGAWETVRRRRRDDVHRTELHEGPDPETGSYHDVPSPDPTPDVEVALRDRDSLLWATFRSLPERCRELLRLVSLADRPDYKHISAAIGMPVGSIGATRGRCLAKLRTLLDEAGADDSWRNA